jgi:hypothetical protein
MKLFFIGDSWASKGFTEQNHNIYEPSPTDIKLPDFWSVPYKNHSLGGKGNLVCLDYLLEQKLPADLPIVWVYTEPGRDYARITGNADNNAWLSKEDYFTIRPELDKYILKEIQNRLPNPIAFIGGLSDVDVALAEGLGFHVLHPSWQKWMADRINFNLDQGWGAPDLMWRMKSNGVKRPAKTLTFKCINWLKFYKQVEIDGYMHMYHPSVRSNKEFGKYLEPQLINWIGNLA